jgi:hypothetical protein
MKTTRRALKKRSRAAVAHRKGARAVRTIRKPAHKKHAAVKPSTVDLGQLFKADYIAPREPVLIDMKPARYLAIAGEGAPGGPLFQSRIGAVYSVAYTTKVTRKAAGLQDYTVNRVEGRYLNLGEQPMPPPEQWQWQLLIRVPSFLVPEELPQAVAKLRQRGKEGDAGLVTLEEIDEGRCVQMLHVGPYTREAESVEKMCAFAKAQGLQIAGPHHEIYLSDPRRVAPEKLKTILRIPVTAPEPPKLSTPPL